MIKRITLLVVGLICSVAYADESLNWASNEVILSKKSNDYERENGQLLRHDKDGVIYWRDVYTTPEGKTGYIDNFERIDMRRLQRKSTHIGPESRKSEDWKDV